MAEYCKKCANKLGIRPDTNPLFCEGCGQEFNDSIITRYGDILNISLAFITGIITTVIIITLGAFILKHL